MRSPRCVSLLLLFLLAGCTHFHEGSATATLEQIQTHLIAQLHLHSLALESDGKDSFSGTGSNDTGEFTIHAARQGGQILFQGVYRDQTHGKFNGSASWTKTWNTFLRSHKSRESAKTTLTTVQQ